MANNYIDINDIREGNRSSELITIENVSTSSLVSLQAIHGTLITFSNLYLEKNGVLKIKKAIIKQTGANSSGLSLGKFGLKLLLLNINTITPTAGNEITFPSGTSEDDVVGIVNISASDWNDVTSNYTEVIVKPDEIIKGTSVCANQSKNLYGIIIAKEPGQFPIDVALKIQLFTEPIANFNDES